MYDISTLLLSDMLDPKLGLLFSSVISHKCDGYGVRMIFADMISRIPSGFKGS